MHFSDFVFIEPSGQGWVQVGELGLAFVLSSLIGLERETRMKSAGLRTHTLVGVGAALIMLVSKYGFGDIAASGHTAFDPSRVAAQIVSGIGFIGGGLIFVRGDAVRGLTTAAVVWLTAAIGMACAAGLPLLALCATLAHFFVVYGYTPFKRHFFKTHYELVLAYRQQEDVMHSVLSRCAQREFVVNDFAMHTPASADNTVCTTLQLAGRQPIQPLLVILGEIDGVTAVQAEALE